MWIEVDPDPALEELTEVEDADDLCRLLMRSPWGWGRAPATTSRDALLHGMLDAADPLEAGDRRQLVHGPFPAEPLAVKALDEQRQRRLPRFLPMIGDFAELSRIQPELAGHLDLRMREVVPLAPQPTPESAAQASSVSFP